MTKEEWANAWDQDVPRSGPFPRDLAAMNFLNELAPPDEEDLICSAEHDEIWFSVDCAALREMLSGNDIEKLKSYGVLWDRSTDALCMFR